MPVIMAGPLTVDTGTREARINRAKLLLTDGEFDLLRVLVSDPHRLWTVPELVGSVARCMDMPDPKNWLDIRAAHLTALLLKVGVRTDILNHRGFHGPERAYRLFEPVPAVAA